MMRVLMKDAVCGSVRAGSLRPLIRFQTGLRASASTALANTTTNTLPPLSYRRRRLPHQRALFGITFKSPSCVATLGPRTVQIGSACRTRSFLPAPLISLVRWPSAPFCSCAFHYGKVLFLLPAHRRHDPRCEALSRWTTRSRTLHASRNEGTHGGKLTGAS